jgi:hypothetical protein
MGLCARRKSATDAPASSAPRRRFGAAGLARYAIARRSDVEASNQQPGASNGVCRARKSKGLIIPLSAPNKMTF